MRGASCAFCLSLCSSTVVNFVQYLIDRHCKNRIGHFFCSMRDLGYGCGQTTLLQNIFMGYKYYRHMINERPGEEKMKKGTVCLLQEGLGKNTMRMRVE